MPRITVIIIAVIVLFAVTALAGRHIFLSLFPGSVSVVEQEQEFIRKALPLLTAQLNEKAPYMIDPTLRFDEAESDSEALTITYLNTFISLTSDDSDFAFVDEHLPGANDYLCNEAQIRKLMSYGVNYIYVYRSRDGETIRRFTFSENDCQNRGQI
jgi:hypothetical protein